MAETTVAETTMAETTIEEAPRVRPQVRKGSSRRTCPAPADHHTVKFVVDEEQKLYDNAFEVKNWGELHRAAEHLARHDIRLVWGPGRRNIDHNIAIYHRNADEVRVEFFCEMHQMRDEALGCFDPCPWHQDTPQRPKTLGKETLRNYWGFVADRGNPEYL